MLLYSSVRLRSHLRTSYIHSLLPDIATFIGQILFGIVIAQVRRSCFSVFPRFLTLTDSIRYTYTLVATSGKLCCSFSGEVRLCLNHACRDPLWVKVFVIVLFLCDVCSAIFTICWCVIPSYICADPAKKLTLAPRHPGCSTFSFRIGETSRRSHSPHGVSRACRPSACLRLSVL